MIDPILENLDLMKEEEEDHGIWDILDVTTVGPGTDTAPEKDLLVGEETEAAKLLSITEAEQIEETRLQDQVEQSLLSVTQFITGSMKRMIFSEIKPKWARLLLLTVDALDPWWENKNTKLYIAGSELKR